MINFVLNLIAIVCCLVSTSLIFHAIYTISTTWNGIDIIPLVGLGTATIDLIVAVFFLVIGFISYKAFR